MSGDLDAAGNALVAGALGAAIEKGEGKAGERQGPCPNCGAPLGGNFCSNCGQPAHIHRSLFHLFEEALHGLIHFDGKAWRTFPMLIGRPGALTRAYVHGKRARFLSPVATFLFTVFAMFVVFSFAGGVSVVGEDADPTPPPTAEERQAILQERLDAVRAERAAAQAAGDADAVADLDKAEANLEAMTRGEPLPHPMRGSIGISAGAQERPDLGISISSSEPTLLNEDAPWQDQWRAAIDRGDVEVNFFNNEEWNKKVLAKLRNPDLVLYKLQQTAYKFSFLLIPISLPFVALLFAWRKGVTLFDHGAFVLYSLSFMSLWFIAITQSGNLPDGLVAIAVPLLVFIVPPTHMFFHLKGAYALGWFSALWRTVLLVLFANICLALFALAIILIGLIG